MGQLLKNCWVQCFSSQPPSPTLWGALPSPGHLALRRVTRCLLTLLRLACFSGEGACGAVGDTECLLLLECRPGQVTSRGSFGSSVSHLGAGEHCCLLCSWLDSRKYYLALLSRVDIRKLPSSLLPNIQLLGLLPSRVLGHTLCDGCSSPVLLSLLLPFALSPCGVQGAS